MLDDAALFHLLKNEFQSDRISDDVTARLLAKEGAVACTAWIIAKEPGVFCGERVAAALGRLLAPDFSVRCLVSDRARIEPRQRLVELRGPAGFCLSVERTALNLFSHLCGIATLTRQFVDAVGPHRARILATRKTLPGLRDVQLYAVECGGGHVHRRSLSDGILIKENHQVFVPPDELLERARAQRSPLHGVEIEVQDLETLEKLAAAPPEVVMLDNMDLATMAMALEKLRGECQVEVSGGIKLEQVPAIAALGVDYISVGKLTHSVCGLDLSLDMALD